MWVRFTLAEVRGIAHYLGMLVVGVALTMLLPLGTALVLGEWGPALDYFIGAALAGTIGVALMLADVTSPQISNRQSLLISSLAWLFAALVGAVPLALSGNYGSYLDALFDAMSGFTTSGLTVVQDLDHMAHAHNMWRHLTHLIGGQGIIVAAISLALAMKGGAISLYMAEGRDERILPNVLHTARFIWFVTAVWVTFGTTVLSVINWFSGMGAVRGFLHGFWLTMAAFDTGGFGPQSQNALYYHNPYLEAGLLMLMLAGTFNFSLHADLWRGDRLEVFKNIEAKTLAANIAICVGLVAISFGASSLLSTDAELWRKGVFHIISANSGTGLMTVYPGQWSQMGGAAIFAIVLAMGFGGMVSSTAGGIKSLRIGLMLSSVVLSVKQALSPRSAVVRVRFHHLVERFVTPEITASAFTYFTLYAVSYISGGVIGAAYGYDPAAAIFESVSAAANVGLSVGITGPMMPTGLKVLYIVQMWSGRLEFLSLIALVVAVLLAVKPHRGVAS
ncbi:MAG: TrkH family potassium uptake protein [Coriobacteriia bacterium]|nr:TrkH family potassium uptake protein [Coriobacteriia bacterium]